MSLINKEISDFTVQAYHEDAFKEVSKADVLGKWGVFFFYPADFTFVCLQSWKTWQRSIRNFRRRDARYTLVSCDTHYVHKAWHDASDRIKKIAYPMLADPTHVLSRDFEVYIEATA